MSSHPRKVGDVFLSPQPQKREIADERGWAVPEARQEVKSHLQSIVKLATCPVDLKEQQTSNLKQACLLLLLLALTEQCAQQLSELNLVRPTE